MKKPILIALMAAVAMPAVSVPVAANAQSNREIRRDRREVREQRRDVRQAQRRGDRRDVRRERRQLQSARRELRQDRADRNRRWGQNDWRGYRDHNRNTFRRGAWRAPFRYQHFRPGLRIRSSYYAPRYVISDPWRYHLPAAGHYLRWVRHYDDMLLVDVRRGVVVRVIPGFFW